MPVSRTLITAVSAAALLSSACGSSTGGSAAPASTGSSTEASTGTSTTSAKSGSATASSAKPKAASGDVTPPDTELKVGDRAVVPFEYGTDQKGTIAIVVTAIEQGSNADLAAFGDKAKGITPYYIRVSVENVGGTDLSYSSVRLRAVGADGRSTGVIITGETPQCQSETAKKDFTTAGAKYETCVLQGAREGDGTVAGAEYNEGDDYLKSPITWKR
ncbi:hypothetical protein GCM10027184_72890 [Saccharothrix stipae]